MNSSLVAAPKPGDRLGFRRLGDRNQEIRTQPFAGVSSGSTAAVFGSTTPDRPTPAGQTARWVNGKRAFAAYDRLG
jgi:hypothetical protein